MYVQQSACMLLFLSKGYLLSMNCLREVRASVEQRKPHVLVWEQDASKGGAPLVELREKECPEDLQAAVFGLEGAHREVIQW